MSIPIHSERHSQRIEMISQAIQDLANQHQQIAVNHAELLKMILQLQSQITVLEGALQHCLDKVYAAQL